MLKLAIADQLFATRRASVRFEMVINVRITFVSRCKLLIANVTGIFDLFDALNFEKNFCFCFILWHNVLNGFESVVQIQFRYSPFVQFFAHIHREHVLREMSVANDMFLCNSLHIQVNRIAPRLST